MDMRPIPPIKYILPPTQTPYRKAFHCRKCDVKLPRGCERDYCLKHSEYAQQIIADLKKNPHLNPKEKSGPKKKKRSA